MCIFTRYTTVLQKCRNHVSYEEFKKLSSLKNPIDLRTIIFHANSYFLLIISA